MKARQDPLKLATELALAGVTAAAVVGMHRLFVDGSFRGPLLLQVALAHLCVALLRRARVRLGWASLVTLGVGAIVIAATQYLETTWALLPSPETFSTIWEDIDEAWLVFQRDKAPAIVEPGFVVTTSIVVWVIAFIADWGAFRTGVSFEALLPPATLFIFAAILGAEGGRAGGAALFVFASMVFVLLHRTWRQHRAGAWAVIQHASGRAAMVSGGVLLITFAVLPGSILGPQLPGAQSAGLLDWKDLGDDEETRVVVSPLVDIQSRLVDQPDVEVFTVRTPGDTRGSYWRLTALDDFDGQIWRSSYETDDADGSLPPSAESGASTRTVTQTITIRALAQIWLPAAFRPTSFEAEDAEVDYDAASSTLIVDRGSESSDGLSYTITSEIPTWTPEQLRGADADAPDAIRSRYLELPAEFSDDVRTWAEDRTAGQRTKYDKAVTLMHYLRDNFRYSLDVQRGHSDDALERFLFETQTGYCEQFAGAYAAMMRSLDVPSRVVVGFTKGVQDQYEPTLFRVKGKHAHAWVELYFEGYGWVPFDPTPTRGIPGGEAWLGVEEDQVDEGASGAPNSTTPQGQPETPAPAPGGPVNQDVPPVGAGNEITEREDGSKDDGAIPFVPQPIEESAVWIGLGALAYVVLVPTAIVTALALRRRGARTPAAKVRLAWQQVDEEITAAGLRLDPSLTVAERAVVMRRALPETAPNIELLARAVEQVAYAESAPSEHQLGLVDQAMAHVTAAARGRRSRWRVLLSYVDIRRLLPRRRHQPGTGPSASQAPAPAPTTT